MRKGSKPCRLRPVGRMAGVRSRSPPGAGRTKPASSAWIRPGSLVVLGHQTVAAGQLFQQRQAGGRRPPCPPATSDLGDWPATSACTVSRSSRWPCDASASDMQQVHALRLGGHRAHHVQAVRDQRVFQLQHLLGQAGHLPRRQRRTQAGSSAARCSSAAWAWIIWQPVRRARAGPRAPGCGKRSIADFRSTRPLYRPACASAASGS
jgi:hypothetical protein